jgi:hypothetical protein
MGFTRGVVGCAVAVIAGSAAPAFGADVDCGQPNPGGGEAARATLALDSTRTQNNPLQFKGSTHDKAFHLVYVVSGCSLADAAGLHLKVHADGDVAKAMDEPEASAEGSLLLVDLNVHPSFPTGSATPLLTIGGPGVTPVAQPLTMQRKEPVKWPLVITVLAALFGGGIAIYSTYVGVKDRQNHDQRIVWHMRHVVVAFFGGLVATVAVFETGYGKPETFTLDFMAGLTLFVAAATAAAGGAKAGAGSTVALARRQQTKKAENEAEVKHETEAEPEPAAT